MTEDKKDSEGAPKWEKRELEINNKMRELCKLGIQTTEAEIASLRKKLKKLQYG